MGDMSVMTLWELSCQELILRRKPGKVFGEMMISFRALLQTLAPTSIVGKLSWISEVNLNQIIEVTIRLQPFARNQKDRYQTDESVYVSCGLNQLAHSIKLLACDNRGPNAIFRTDPRHNAVFLIYEYRRFRSVKNVDLFSDLDIRRSYGIVRFWFLFSRKLG